MPTEKLCQMDAQIKREWVKALRSGKYRRAQGQLKKGRAYCCLGVLCVVAKGEVDWNSNDGFLPSNVRDELGITEQAEQLLTYMNDGKLLENDFERLGRPKGYKNGKGAPFRVIADVIEKRL